MPGHFNLRPNFSDSAVGPDQEGRADDAHEGAPHDVGDEDAGAVAGRVTNPLLRRRRCCHTAPTTTEAPNVRATEIVL